MGLADGDLYVSGSILSYQQLIRIYTNFRGASVPSALKAGALWSDSGDDKLHHRGASAVEEILQLTRSFDVSPQFATIRVMDAGADHYLDIRCTEELTGNKILLFDIADTNRTITLSGNPTLSDWFDQGVKTSHGPTWGATVRWKKGADKASASTLDISAVDGNYFDVTGTTDITAISTSGQAGTIIKLHFDGILTIVHDGDDIILPDGKDIYTTAGTELEFIEYVSGKWRCTTSLKAKPVLTNLLSNSGVGVWSQSDTNKGLCTIAYDTGAKGGGSAPSVGDACVGDNGATGKVISYTIADGTWNGGDAEGVLTLGACTGSWTVGEVLTFAATETAAVVSEDIGICNDPCNNDGTGDWTDADTILSFDTDHYEIASDAGDEKTYITGLSFTEGKIYKVEAQLKDGTATPTDIQLVSLDGAVVEYSSKPINTTAAFVTYSCTFEATSGTDGVGIITPTSLAGNNIEMKYFICYEITPCCTGGNVLAFDGWYRNHTTLDLYRQHNDGGTLTKDGSFYSLMMVPSAGAEQFSWNYNIRNLAEFYQQFAGRTTTIGLWAKTSTANHFKIRVYDTGYNESSYHTGGGAWEWIEVTVATDATPAQFGLYVHAAQAGDVDGSTIIYLSQPMLVFGSSIGEGNYQPKQGEWVQLEKAIPFNTLNNKTALSDVAFADLNVEAESNAMIPKGAKALLIGADVNDSDSAGTDCYLVFRKDATLAEQLYFSPYGLVNDKIHRGLGIINLDADGDLDYKIEASGGSTFDITKLKVYGVKVN